MQQVKMSAVNKAYGEAIHVTLLTIAGVAFGDSEGGFTNI